MRFGYKDVTDVGEEFANDVVTGIYRLFEYEPSVRGGLHAVKVSRSATVGRGHQGRTIWCSTIWVFVGLHVQACKGARVGWGGRREGGWRIDITMSAKSAMTRQASTCNDVSR